MLYIGSENNQIRHWEQVTSITNSRRTDFDSNTRYLSDSMSALQKGGEIRSARLETVKEDFNGVVVDAY